MVSRQCSECCSFDLGCLSKSFPAEEEAHHICNWLRSCSDSDIDQFSCDHACRLAMLAASTIQHPSGRIFLRILQVLYCEVLANRPAKAPGGRGFHALQTAATTLTDLMITSVRQIPADFAASLLETLEAACKLLPPSESCLHHNQSFTPEPHEPSTRKRVQWDSTSWYPSFKGHSDTLVCARCRLVAVAVEHLSSGHILLAKVSADLLKTTIHSFGSFAPALEALQQSAALWGKQQALQEVMPPGIQSRIRNSMAESSLLKALLCVHALLSAMRDVPTEMSCLAILDALQLSQLVLNSHTCSPPRPCDSSIGSLSSRATLAASISCWTVLVPPDQHFHPSQTLRRTAVTLMKAVASNPIIWSGGSASDAKDDHPGTHALECEGQMQLPEADDQNFRGNTFDGGCSYIGGPSQSLRLHSQSTTRKIASMDGAVAAVPEASVTAISSVMLRFICNGAEEPRLQACAMQCAAAALFAGGVDACVGSELIRAGAAAVGSTLQDLSAKSEAQDAPGAVSVCGGNGLAAAEAFVSAAVGWLHARPKNDLTQPLLQNTVDLMENSVIWPALELLACSQQPHASAGPALAAPGEIHLRSGAIPASVAILRSISQFPGWCVGGTGRSHVREAARQCVRNVQAVLAGLPSGHVITAACVQAVVCLLDLADAIDKHDMCEDSPATNNVVVAAEMLVARDRPPVWEWLAMSCLRELLTPIDMAKSLHVLSPILRTILEVRQRQLCSSALLDLLADRMAVLDRLDVSFSRRLFCVQAVGSQCGRSAKLEHLDEVHSTTSVEGEVPARMVVANDSYIQIDSLSSCQGQIKFETCGRTQACSQTDAICPTSCLLDAVESTGVSGTVMMHVKQMLELHQEGQFVNNLPVCK